MENQVKDNNEQKTYSKDEITELKLLLEQGIEQCRDENAMDACSFGYEKGVLITGNDAVYLLSLMQQPEAAGQEQENRGARWLNNYFKSLRYNKNHHLGLGDIRLTIAMQEEIIQYLISSHERP